ncbi:hypothetical protein MAQ5080_03014 [Marinomonas aquimarina]|uniref:Copper chaperone PCu(A)C n=1 Tax=Marinomonas aquimarina TaxID=295068 RepID=A0A1A8TMG8_9GAMM|nr:copper chaperone PCu(A)C [Marinomonas aquimarina]SBS34914.1 hypothetical protein MAQ5080_03014 [Marinomonas aquimarina]
MSIRMFSKLALTLAAATSTLALAASLEVVDPAVRAMPPGAPASGAYVTLVNHSDQERFLVDVESAAADTVEVHVSKMQGETMVMNRVAQIVVPAHGQAMLKPGGYHIMLIGLSKPLQAGDQVDFTLVMKNGERIPMQAPVLSPEEMAKYTPMKAMDHSNMHHGEMDHSNMAHGKKAHGHAQEKMEKGEHHAHH